ncbi:cytochrome c biogenesis protein CcsA, partial [Parasutterella excrementihominis]
MGQWSGISDFFAMGGYAQYVWGAYWVWDARLTSALILFFFYLGYIA